MQSRRLSAIETTTSTAVGLLVSLALNATVLPLFGFHPTAGQNVGLTAIYTVASLLRGYALRRAFNRIKERL